ncbi:MAG: alanyl-tRNA editing protein [Gammaproteobacteria bacterium]|nr:MAG: alanyl-tRNA editing protein [Gammaproteobacteria bacterium]
MTEELFRSDAYLRECEATIESVDAQGVRLDRTVFYPRGGGQPGDQGVLRFADGRELAVIDTVFDKESRHIVHLIETPLAADDVGTGVVAAIDWARRFQLMRVHTLLHLLCAVVPAGVTGGSIREGSGRLDFDLPESTLDKEELTAALNRLVSENHGVQGRWIADAELEANPQMVRTMSVKPPVGQGRVRVIEVAGVDLQPCGGTHVRSTGEIGSVRVTKIEKKGRMNRRVNVCLVDTES